MYIKKVIEDYNYLRNKLFEAANILCNAYINNADDIIDISITAEKELHITTNEGEGVGYYNYTIIPLEDFDKIDQLILEKNEERRLKKENLEKRNLQLEQEKLKKFEIFKSEIKSILLSKNFKTSVKFGGKFIVTETEKILNVNYHNDKNESEPFYTASYQNSILTRCKGKHQDYKKTFRNFFIKNGYSKLIH